MAAICLLTIFAHAQDNYEIQVYGSETIPRGVTMIELHNNFTAMGAKKTDDGTLPTNHAWHETIEITHGFNDWFETGFYIFTSARNGSGWDFVGTHIRPRFRVPPKWHWPVGVSLSQEIGYERRKFPKTRGAGRFGPSSTKTSSAGIFRSILRSSGRSRGRARSAVLSSPPISKSRTPLRKRSMAGLNTTAHSDRSLVLIPCATNSIRYSRRLISMYRQSGSLILALALA